MEFHMANAKHGSADAATSKHAPGDKHRGDTHPTKRTVEAAADTSRPTTKSKRGGSSNKILRISFLVPREAIPRLEWMMKVRSIPTKVDLLRVALNHYEDHVIDEEASRAEKRRLAGAPPLTDPAD